MGIFNGGFFKNGIGKLGGDFINKQIGIDVFGTESKDKKKNKVLDFKTMSDEEIFNFTFPGMSYEMHQQDKKKKMLGLSESTIRNKEKMKKVHNGTYEPTTLEKLKAFYEKNKVVTLVTGGTALIGSCVWYYVKKKAKSSFKKSFKRN